MSLENEILAVGSSKDEASLVVYGIVQLEYAPTKEQSRVGSSGTETKYLEPINEILYFKIELGFF